MTKKVLFLNRYHPVVNFLFRPIYKLCGGRYNPVVAENVVGATSYVFHTVVYSVLDGTLMQAIQEGDIKKLSSAATFCLFFPVIHGIKSYSKNEVLKEEKKTYRKELRESGETANIEELVDEEFNRRRNDYSKSPKFYTGFEKISNV